VSRSVARVLDDRSKESGLDRKAVLARMAAMEMEYEDEYDDSFDELAGGIADGNADIEGENDVSTTSKGPSPTVAQAAAKAREAIPSGKQPAKGKPLYVLDGKIYNYKKEGARAVSTTQEAEVVIQEEAMQIMGLGPGGNKSVDNGKPLGDAVAPHAFRSLSSGRGGGRGSAKAGRTGDSGSRGRGSYARKEKNKSAIANHNRKDRALKKNGM